MFGGPFTGGISLYISSDRFPGQKVLTSHDSDVYFIPNDNDKGKLLHFLGGKS